MTSRTGYSQRKFLTIGAVFLCVLLAGCAGYVPFGDSEPSADPTTTHVPETSDAVVTVDTEILTDDPTITLTEGLAAAHGHTEDVESVHDEFETTTGLPADEVTAVTGFTIIDPEKDVSHDDHTALIIESGWSETAVVGSVEETYGVEYEPTQVADAENVTLYDPDYSDTAGERTPHIATVDDSTLVVGDYYAVKDAIGVETGDVDPFIDDEMIPPVTSEDDTYAAFAFHPSSALDDHQAIPHVDDEAVSEIQYVSGTYSSTPDDETVTMETELHPASGSSVDELDEMVTGWLAFNARAIETNDETPHGDYIADELREIDVTPNDDTGTVTVEYTTTPEDLIELLEAVQDSEVTP